VFHSDLPIFLAKSACLPTCPYTTPPKLFFPPLACLFSSVYCSFITSSLSLCPLPPLPFSLSFSRFVRLVPLFFSSLFPTPSLNTFCIRVLVVICYFLPLLLVYGLAFFLGPLVFEPLKSRRSTFLFSQFFPFLFFVLSPPFIPFMNHVHGSQ